MSTLEESPRAGRAVGSSPDAKPRVSVIEVATLLALVALIRVGAYVARPLTSWLTVGDACVMVVVVAAAIWLVRRARREGAETLHLYSSGPLIAAGAISGAAALAVVAGVASLALDPLAITGSAPRPRLHNWVWSMIGLLVAAALGWLSSLFWRKLARR
jgi:hypothetical protein